MPDDLRHSRFLSVIVLQRLLDALHCLHCLDSGCPGFLHPGQPEFLVQLQLVHDPGIPVHIPAEAVIDQDPLREFFREFRGESRITILEMMQEDFRQLLDCFFGSGVPRPPILSISGWMASSRAA